MKRLPTGPPASGFASAYNAATDLSDEAMRARWLENPYWRLFTGEVVFRTRLPCDASALTCWNQHVGNAGLDELLAHAI